MAKILIVEDDKAILMLLKDDLELEGYTVSTASDGKTGLQLALEQEFQLIILDILLPKMNGYDVCKKLRDAGRETPVLMLTAARTEEMDKVLGLELGADDYVTKPVGSRELIARVKAITRRSDREPRLEEVLTFGDVSVNFKSYEVSKAGVALHLTAIEFKILKLLIQHKNEVVTRDAILDEVWNSYVVSPRAIEPHIVHLRQKIENDPSNPEYILNVRGIGFKFRG